ncbi:MAG TPA: type II toxin-antitoxin system HicB family antitoxin [Thermoplasmata archaeon]|nr:type II toxin-antitoxin system HicB family antitoxin [Thermoplasmata archaeon]
MKVRLSAVVHREGKWFVAHCPELDVASQGRSVEESLTNLREALELRLEDGDVHLPEEPFLLTTVEVERVASARAPRP